jgi:hypothetical protein
MSKCILHSFSCPSAQEEYNHIRGLWRIPSGSIKLENFYISCSTSLYHGVRFIQWYFVVYLTFSYMISDRRLLMLDLEGHGILIFTTTSRPAVRPTQPPIQWVQEALSLGVKRPFVKLTTHLHLMQRSRTRGAIPPLPPILLHGVVLS